MGTSMVSCVCFFLWTNPLKLWIMWRLESTCFLGPWKGAWRSHWNIFPEYTGSWPCRHQACSLVVAFLYLFWHTQTVFVALLLSHKYYSFALLWPGWEEWKTLEDFLSGFQGQFSSVEENCYDCGIVHVVEHITWTRLHTSTLGWTLGSQTMQQWCTPVHP